MNTTPAQKLKAISLTNAWKQDRKSYEEIRTELSAGEILEAMNTLSAIKERAKEQAKTSPFLFNADNFKRSQV
jgi:hypothetical protein